ncbi:MAG: hypothetical protein CEE38_09355 [Planctomycetes bacterium B3_Pla]|nr:MAG: hypothetical protein CEE38_09355 [Planctomycetes bacterium B3_Pla]
MKEQTAVTSSSENKPESSWLRKAFWNLIGPIIVGLMAMLGQLYVNPIVAKRVKTQESIAEKRYEVCENAIGLLQKSLASSPWNRAGLPEGYTPPEKPPTQLELNLTYSLLATYGTSGGIADEFLYAFGFQKDEKGDWIKTPNPEIDSPPAVGRFILKLREELGIKGTSFDPNTFGYMHRIPREKNR